MEEARMNTRKSCLMAIVLMGLAAAPSTRADNILVSEPVLTGQVPASHYTYIQFDLSWENSFRDDINWDAAWVFVKYQEADGKWKHAYLNTSANEHVMPAGYESYVGVTGSHGMGVFIYRSSSGSGNASLSSARIRWEYGANGLSDLADVRLKIFAVEMVYVPQSAFYLGDTDADRYNCFYTYGTSNPYHVTSEALINIGQTNGYLWASGALVISTLPAAFPKGFNSFYCMKYEISQGQYADFLNTLNTAQSDNRYPDENGNNRHTITQVYPDYTASRPDRACNYLSWDDGAAYADWAGLRPMTELEFEKACRGPLEPVDDEFAWGTNRFTQAVSFNGVEDGTETIITDGANCNVANQAFIGGDEGKGPIRCGIFATATSTREGAGASYYGIMELSGNVAEHVVNVSDGTGRSFTGLHGDGVLVENNGKANVTGWPSVADGTGFRGGDLYWGAAYSTIAYRIWADLNSISRDWCYGFRCVRSAE
jgi:formylglycine-generating enzyme required for sulfatase activity